MAITRFSNNRYEGLSSDTKPTNLPNGSVFYETNTSTFWELTAGVWTEKSVRNAGSDYDVYISGGVVKAKNNRTGLVKYTHASDVGALTNTIIADFTTTGCKIRYANDLFTINTPIVIPTADAGLSRPWHFEGYIPSNTRDKATQFKVGSTFPDQDYTFKCEAANGTGQNACITIKGFFLNNRSYAKDGNGTTNILNGADGPERIDAGFLKYESDKTLALGGGSPCVIEDVSWHYFWRGIHLLGYLYRPVIVRCGGWDANAHFVGDFDLKLERSSNLGNTQHGPTVDLKLLFLRNFTTTHSAGDSTQSGRGSMNDAVVFFGGYHNVAQIYINGRKYNNSVYSFKQCFSSTFEDLNLIDLDGTQGAGFQACFLLDTTDPTGNAAYSSYSTYNNIFKKLTGTHASNGIKFLNSPYRNRLEAYAYWGSNLTINDAAAGVENIVELIEGQQQLATTNSKITSTNNVVKIIDKRVGAENRGLSAAQTGNGSNTAFNIQHNCFTTPVTYHAIPVTSAAQAASNVTVNQTNIIVTFTTAPANGASLRWSWYASVY